MLVLNDIDIIKYLRPLDLLKEKEFQISDLFLGDFYLTPQEKQIIHILEKDEKIKLFTTDLGFNNLIDLYSVCPPEAASLYYAKLKRLPLVTQSDITKEVCDKMGITVYKPCEALKFLNKSDEKIDYVERMLNRIEV